MSTAEPTKRNYRVIRKQGDDIFIQADSVDEFGTNGELSFTNSNGRKVAQFAFSEIVGYVDENELPPGKRLGS